MTARHRLFAYLLLMRPPMALELADIDAVYAWARRNALWLAGAYVLVLVHAVWPAFAQEHVVAYRVIAVVATHFLLWIAVSTVATCWVGFRVGYWASSFGGAIQAIVATTLLFALYFFLYADADLQRLLRRWLSETFGSVWMLVGGVLLVAYGVPDLVSRLRRRERAAVTRALAAEAASERLARQTAESELRLLQAQVEPHFLYNTLANLRFLIQKNSPDALRMTDALIEYLRTSVPDMRAQRVPLGREVDHARHFLEIMHMRMGTRLAFTVDVPEALRDVEVAPLSVLTLVENAVKHGIAPSVSGGSVALRAREAGESIEIEVADTGVGLNAEATRASSASTGVGLENLRGRLQIAYGRPVSIELLPNTPSGTRARFVVPKVLPQRSEEGGQVVVRVISAEAARSARLLDEPAKEEGS